MNAKNIALELRWMDWEYRS